MADTMQFDLVSPERSLASLQVTAVQSDRQPDRSFASTNSCPAAVSGSRSSGGSPSRYRSSSVR